MRLINISRFFLFTARLLIILAILSVILSFMAEEWQDMVVSAVVAVLFMAFHVRAQRIRNEMLPLINLKMKLYQLVRELLKDGDPWEKTTYKGLLMVTRNQFLWLTTFKIYFVTADDLSDGYNPVDHSVVAPCEAIALNKLIAKVVRIHTVFDSRETGIGRFSGKFEGSDMSSREMIDGLGNELIAANEEDLRAMIDLVQFSRDY